MVDSLVRDGYLSVDFYDEDNNGGYHSLMQYYSLTDLGISAQKEEWKLRRHPNAKKRSLRRPFLITTGKSIQRQIIPEYLE
ncbi:hypothetical protein ACCH91_000837 [Serratia marcescens]